MGNTAGSQAINHTAPQGQTNEQTSARQSIQSDDISQSDDIEITTDIQMGLQNNKNECPLEIPSRPKRQCRAATTNAAFYYYGRNPENVKTVPKLPSRSNGTPTVLKKKTEKKQPVARKAAVKATQSKSIASKNVLAIADNKQSSSANVRSTAISCVPAEPQPRKRTNQRVMSYVDHNTRSTRTRNASKSRAMSIDQKEILDDGQDANSTLVVGKNTKQQMYSKNPLYKTCIHCHKKFVGSIVQHYVKNHPDHEVPISRMSPQMAQRLKRQTEIYKIGAGQKISGFCYFCEETKCCAKFNWQRHLLTHTGEEMFNCRQCHAQMKAKNEHDAKLCKSSVANVFETKDDGSLVGFMCNDCNYFQFSRGRLLSHLKNEHGFQNPIQPNNFQEWAVVKTQKN